METGGRSAGVMIEFLPDFIPSLSSNGQVINYEGFMDICGHSYFLSVCVPGKLAKASLACEWKLERQVSHKEDLIKQRLHSASSLEGFLREFKMIAETCIQRNGSSAPIWSDRSEEIMEQVLELDREWLLDIAEDLSSITLGISDDADRLHKLKVVYPLQDTSATPIFITELPQKPQFLWSNNTRLHHLLDHFKSCVAACQPIFNTLREIDEKCWVLEPEHPTFVDTHRRLALGSNLSLHITVSCQQPTSLPECHFMGADSATAPLREKLNTNTHRWDVERSLLNNLEEVLDLDFPSRADTSVSDLSMDCGICYCMHLGDEVPNIVCEDSRCAQAFHHSCLFEWLRNMSSRQSFNTVFGECPLCSHPIKVKIPST